MGSYTAGRILVLLLVAVLTARGAEIVFLGPAELPRAIVNRSYSPPQLRAQSSGGCASGGIGYRIESGSLPPGVALSAGGYLTGTPAASGTYAIVVKAANGCAWSSRKFWLSVSAPPALLATPSIVQLRWKQDARRPTAVLLVSSSWADLPYYIRVQGDWLDAVPEQGRTTSNGRLTAMDVIVLRPRLEDRLPGVFTGMLEIRAWQAEALRVPIELIVD